MIEHLEKSGISDAKSEMLMKNAAATIYAGISDLYGWVELYSMNHFIHKPDP